ncbi:MAG: GNAT family N-acetyltransferase [Patescibacteria group bacterium]
MKNIQIKKINLNQLPEVIKMTWQAFNVPFLKGGIISDYKESENLKEMVENKKIFILAALSNNKIVGAVRYKSTANGQNIYLFRLAVLKFYRYMGIGSKLVKRVEKITKKLGYKKIKLDCVLEKGLFPYYKKLGYRVYNIKKHDDHYDVFMYKRVNSFKK